MVKQDHRICVGQIVGAHGVRGDVRLHSFTEEPDAIFDYEPLTDKDGEKVFALKPKSIAKDHYVVAVEGVKDRSAAESMRGTKLFASRAALPKPGKRQFYATDLVGLAVTDREGKSYGEVLRVHAYGAGPFLEIGKAKGDSFMLPFTDKCVPEVDLKAGTVMIDIPLGWL